MFKRRNPLNFIQKIKNLFWPSLSWNRYGKYLVLKLNRLGGDNYSISAGLACGVAISFTPFVGLHFLLAALTAIMIRGNILASAIGTAIGNPSTFPFIWIATLNLGKLFLGQAHTSDIPFLEVFQNAIKSFVTGDFSSFAQDVWPVMLPMLVGSIPFYIVSWVVSYYLARRALDEVKKLRKRRSEKRKARLEKI